MRGEQIAEAHASEKGLNNEEVRGRWRCHQRLAPRVSFNLGQRARQCVWIAGPVRSGIVGSVFARTRNGELNQHRGEWRENNHGDGRDASASAALFAVASAHAAEDHSPLGNVGQESDCPRERGRDRTDQDVAIADVAEFVGDHALEFVVIEQTENALRDRDGSVMRDCVQWQRRWANRSG